VNDAATTLAHATASGVGGFVPAMDRRLRCDEVTLEGISTNALARPPQCMANSSQGHSGTLEIAGLQNGRIAGSEGKKVGSEGKKVGREGESR
jgi:hypothetical protein